MEEGAQRPDVVYHLHHLTKWDDSCQSQMQAANDTSSSNTVHTLLLSRVSSPCEGLTLSAHCISNHMCWENHRQRQTNFPNIRKSLWVYICRLSPHRFFFWMLLMLSSALQAFQTHCLWPVLNQRPLGLWTSLSTLWAIRPALSQCDILPLLSLSSGLLGLKVPQCLAKDSGAKVRHRLANPLRTQTPFSIYFKIVSFRLLVFKTWRGPKIPILSPSA